MTSRNRYSLTPEAKEVARLLVEQWDSGQIPQMFSFFEKLGNDGSLEADAIGLGFRTPPRVYLIELAQNGLIRLDKQQRSFRVTLLQSLREAIQNHFGERQPAGVYYTSQQVVKLMVEQIKPKLGETIYDPACGIGTILVGAYRHIEGEKRLSQVERSQLEENTFYGREIEPQAFTHALENLESYSINLSNFWCGDTLLKSTYDRNLPSEFDIIFCSPPVGKTATLEQRDSFLYPSRYIELLFLQHIIESLKIGGRAAVLLPEGVLIRADREFRDIKQHLLDKCEIQRIIRLEEQVNPYTRVKFSLVVFTKGKPTTKIVYAEPNRKPILIDRATIEDNNFDLTPPDSALPVEDSPEDEKFDSSKEATLYRIFISYRRDDTAWPTGRLYDYLEKRLEAKIFRDLDSIGAGQKFNQEIENALQSCDVLLVVIGPNWLGTNDEKGRRRLDMESDWVRREIVTAIEREIMIIPVLVDSASMPHADDLPENIKDLHLRNGVYINPSNFRHEIERIAKTIEDSLYTSTNE